MPTISERHHKRARSLSSLRAVLVIALLSLMCALPDASLAQTAATGSRSQGEVSTISMQLSDEIYSPFCPGKTLSMCPSPNAAKVRRDIQRMAREGMSKDEIKQEVLNVYGEEFRIVEPPAQDNALLLAAILAGLAIAISAVVFLTRRRNAASADTEGGALRDGDASGKDKGGVEDESLDDDELAYLEDIRDELSD
jgi:cytochrome c-type biogenesis protein CcmH/NrfF